ncbi:MAG: helix-turn-helix transcriptional regulator [Brevinematales bacterium]|nr:helix-turn-helix transcriptional regulator [Brevinematales bacterium]
MSYRKTIFNPEYRYFISLLKEYRISKNVTQTELGELLGIDQTYVSKYETFERRLDFIEFRNILKALDIPIHEFLLEFEHGLSEYSEK